MHEHTLNGVIHLFAAFASLKRRSGAGVNRPVEDYLKSTLGLSDAKVHLGLFQDLLEYYTEAVEPDAPEQGVEALCAKLDPLLSRNDKQTFLLHALTIRHLLEAEGTRADALLNRVSTLFHIPESEQADHARFITATLDTPDLPNCRNITPEGRRTTVAVLYSPWTNHYFLRVLSGCCSLDENPLHPDRFYPLEPGAIFRDSAGATLYRCEIERLFTQPDPTTPILFQANNVNFRFPKSDNGLHNLSFRETGGRLIGVMGGSGVGKSTLISLLNGTLPPNSGTITINGVDLYHAGKQLDGVIGYVPQDDLLFEDLTVRENLDYSVRLCLAHLSPEKRAERVHRMLTELNQAETADLKVGNPLSKTISGGQRKRLNIALELIREPAILLVDEPTSGLSSTDSDVVMGLLKAQAARGRLVIVIIHQPSSAIFRLFDALWILDRGGYPVYTGHPLEALRWLREQIHVAGADRSICPECGNVNPEQLFSILETRNIDADGH
ncbi:MAG: ABC transporter ATP-binding protein, partial [Kiritimatiellae bacterium]|nr:ABC transporter ATP-binding protein [Kiritimatiellia bacterium]